MKRKVLVKHSVVASQQCKISIHSSCRQQMIPEIMKRNLQEYFEKKFGLLNNIIGDSENIKDCKGLQRK